MIWIIASLPFWILGCMFLGGAVLLPFRRGPTTDHEIRTFITGLLLAGILFLIAAKVAS